MFQQQAVPVQLYSFPPHLQSNGNIPSPHYVTSEHCSVNWEGGFYQKALEPQEQILHLCVLEEVQTGSAKQCE